MDSSHAQADGTFGAAAESAAVPVPTSPSSDDALRREVDRLSEMVQALSREVATERAARDQLEQIIASWEDREEQGDAEVRSQDGDEVIADHIQQQDEEQRRLNDKRLDAMYNEI